MCRFAVFQVRKTEVQGLQSVHPGRPKILPRDAEVSGLNCFVWSSLNPLKRQIPRPRCERSLQGAGGIWRELSHSFSATVRKLSPLPIAASCCRSRPRRLRPRRLVYTAGVVRETLSSELGCRVSPCQDLRYVADSALQCWNPKPVLGFRDLAIPKMMARSQVKVVQRDNCSKRHHAFRIATPQD